MDNIALIADKNLLSSRQAVEMAGATLSSSESNESDLPRLTLSHSSLHRKRDQLRKESGKIMTAGPSVRCQWKYSGTVLIHSAIITNVN